MRNERRMHERAAGHPEQRGDVDELVSAATLGVLPPNLVILGGTIRAEPEVHRRPSGAPVVRLTLEHPVPGGGGGAEERRTGDTSVLVLCRIADGYPGSLAVGATLLIVGHELGGGEVFADALIPTTF